MQKDLTSLIDALDRQVRAVVECEPKTDDFKEVKEIRDWADAARKFGGGTGLGPEFKRQAAELTLRAERRAVNCSRVWPSAAATTNPARGVSA